MSVFSKIVYSHRKTYFCLYPLWAHRRSFIIVWCEPFHRQTYIFIKIALHLPCEMHKGSEPRHIFNFSLDNALTAVLNSLCLTHTQTLPCPLPVCSTPQGQKQSDFSDSHGGYLEARPLHLQEMPEPVQTQRKRENAYICINYLRLKERQGQLVVSIRPVCVCERSSFGGVNRSVSVGRSKTVTKLCQFCHSCHSQSW